MGLNSGMPYPKVRHAIQSFEMTTATMTSKGQITIPAEVRAVLGVASGDRVEFVQVGPGRFELVAANQSVRDIKGLIGKPAEPVSIDAMSAAIRARGAKAR